MFAWSLTFVLALASVCSTPPDLPNLLCILLLLLFPCGVHLSLQLFLHGSTPALEACQLTASTVPCNYVMCALDT